MKIEGSENKKIKIKIFLLCLLILIYNHNKKIILLKCIFSGKLIVLRCNVVLVCMFMSLRSIDLFTHKRCYLVFLLLEMIIEEKHYYSIIILIFYIYYHLVRFIKDDTLVM